MLNSKPLQSSLRELHLIQNIVTFKPALNVYFLGSDDKALALRDEVLESLLSPSCDSKQIVCQLKERFQLDQSSLEQPDSETKSLIRCLARTAKYSKRLDVVQHLREISPAGTTGEKTIDCKLNTCTIVQAQVTSSIHLGLVPPLIKYC